MKLRCPICGKPMRSPPKAEQRKDKEETRYFPFCSRRCKLIDLGSWLDADYRIPAHQQPEGSEEEIGQ